jgi:CRISPR type III-A-associated RAMP protein Csm4
MERKIILMQPLGSHASPILSHTLFGAACWALAILGWDVDAILEGFADGGPRFAFSNAYPFLCTRDGDPLLLTPRPPFRVPPDVVDAPFVRPIEDRDDWDDLEKRVEQAKKLQKARYVSPVVGERIRSGDWGTKALFDQFAQGQLKIHNDTLWLPAERDRVWGREPSEAWQQIVTQRNSVDRVAGATVEGLLFQQSETFYDRQRAGLWFAVWADDELWPDLRAALRFVEDTGLGGKRSVGKGHFTFSDPEEWQSHFPAPAERQRFLSLSHYIPAAPDETEPLTYKLEVIRQKAENRYPQGKQRVYMATLRAFEPGGLFAAKSPEERLYGKLLPLGDNGHHIVYYSGLTLPLWGAWEV